MKKKMLFVLVMLMSLCLIIACGNKGDNSSKDENGSGDKTTAVSSMTNDDGRDDNAIAVSSATRGYNRNSVEAFVQINFKRGSAKGKLTEVRDVDAKTAGFSTTSDFNLLTISVFSNGLTVYFDATEENYGNLQDIIYTKPLEPVLKDIDGTPVENFSYKLPYHNLD